MGQILNCLDDSPVEDEPEKTVKINNAEYREWKHATCNDKDLVNRTVGESVPFAVATGICSASDNVNDEPRFAHVPFTLFPTALKASSLDFLKKLSPIFGKLTDGIARDYDFLSSELEAVAKGDPDFTGRLLDLYKKQQTQGMTQPMQLGCFRSDYMKDKTGNFYQIELNTIAASFSTLIARVGSLHQYIGPRYFQKLLQYVRNNPSTGLAKGMGMAALKVHPENPTILFIVNPEERNIVDQRGIEYSIWEQFKIPVLRKTLKQVMTEGIMNESKDLIIEGRKISCVYFRNGYDPDHYPSEVQWEARTRIEFCTAVKCPSVGYHLVGSKIIQFVLTKKGVLEKYLSAQECETVRKCFAGLWSLDIADYETEDDLSELIATTKENPDGFVLKPQREGGGHNFYGEDVHQKLSTMSNEERQGYLLMQRVHPTVEKNILVRGGKSIECDCISEFGIYSIFLGDGSKEIANETVGHLVRTKSIGCDEGGVATGYAVLDSLTIVSEN